MSKQAPFGVPASTRPRHLEKCVITVVCGHPQKTRRPIRSDQVRNSGNSGRLTTHSKASQKKPRLPQGAAPMGSSLPYVDTASTHGLAKDFLLESSHSPFKIVEGSAIRPGSPLQSPWHAQRPLTASLCRRWSPGLTTGSTQPVHQC